MTKDEKNMVSTPDKAGWGFHWVSSVFYFSQLKDSNRVMGLGLEPPKALESLAGISI